jgi:hypothetical protein
MALALRVRASAHPPEWQNTTALNRAPVRLETSPVSADVDVIGGLIVLGVFAGLGFVVGLLGLLASL